MPKPKRIPTALGYWPLLSPEMEQFCLAWAGNPISSRQLHRFVHDWKKVACWGGSDVPGQESQGTLISAVIGKSAPISILQIPTINESVLVAPARSSLKGHQVEITPGTLVCGSVLCSRTGVGVGPIRQIDTNGAMLVRVDNLTDVQQTFPEFTSAWLAFTRQILTNRSDKELVTRVWLHTNVWTQHPDRPSQRRKWTDEDFTHKDIAHCIQRDTGLAVSERTVRAVMARLCEEELSAPPKTDTNPT